MTSCQEYLLKIKLGEMNCIWRAHIWKAKGGDAETVEFWPEKPKTCSTRFQCTFTLADRALNQTGLHWLLHILPPRFVLNWWDYCIISLWETRPVGLWVNLWLQLVQSLFFPLRGSYVKGTVYTLIYFLVKRYMGWFIPLSFLLIWSYSQELVSLA